MATSAFDKIKHVLTTQVDLEGDDIDDIAGALVEALQLDDAAVPPRFDSAAYTQAALAFNEAVNVAEGVRNRAKNAGFSEEIAQAMGSTAYLKLLGALGS